MESTEQTAIEGVTTATLQVHRTVADVAERESVWVDVEMAGNQQIQQLQRALLVSLIEGIRFAFCYFFSTTVWARCHRNMCNQSIENRI